ncbi:hypothetical protein P3S67_006087 [Capsicum chacoense]
MILYAFKLPNSDVTALLVRLLFVEVCDSAPPKNPIIGILCFPSYMDKMNILFTDVVKVLEDGDLQTLGMLGYDKRLQHSFTAHPKVDPVTREMFTFGYSQTQPYATYRVISKDGVMQDPVPIIIPASRSGHSVRYFHNLGSVIR